jgi:DNA phosphorothioation-dependent restriction protein DptH
LRSTPDFISRPIIRLELDADERALISEIHDASDWVFTVDRNMGIEFFDHGGRRDRPDYLIDYTPATVPEHGHRLVISSRSLSELEAILRPVLKQYGLDAEGRQAILILEQLRSLSGRLALKLVSSPTARAEALGMALARLYLNYQGALRNQIVVPLDAHLDLFQSTRRHAEEIGDEVTLRRTDLALFDLDLARRIITCNLVEVKCYAQNLGLSGYGQLKERITEQLNQSERILQQHFDPHRTTPDRPDRLLKTRELATLLEFYLDRGVRYGLMVERAAEEARTFLELLEQGYTLRFTRSGLVFDFDKPDTEPPERDVGIEFHRIGGDLIRALVEQAAPRTQTTPSSEGGDSQSGEGGPAPTPPEGTPPRVLVIPRLNVAAFLVDERQRVTAVDIQPADEGGPPTPTIEDKSASKTEAHSAPKATSSPAKVEREARPRSSQPAKNVPAERAGLRKEEGTHVEPVYDIILGATQPSPQFGLLGARPDYPGW